MKPVLHGNSLIFSDVSLEANSSVLVRFIALFEKSLVFDQLAKSLIVGFEWAISLTKLKSC